MFVSRYVARASRRAFSGTPNPAPRSLRSMFYVGALSAFGGGLLVYSFTKASTPKNVATDQTLLRDVKYADASSIDKAIAQISSVVGNDNIDTNSRDCEVRADSEWQSRHHHPNEVAKAVVRPGSTDEVSRIVKICNEFKVPLVPVSGGTSLEGHFTPIYGGIALDMGRMDAVLKLNKNDLDIVVQPAIGWEQLKEFLAPHGLMFGTDAGPGAEVGGMCACCASGIGAFRYGPMRHNVINMTVVLADGTIIKTRKRPRKTSAGYSLNDLFIGSEGTLGIITELTLRVSPAGLNHRVGVLTFDKIEQATSTVQELLLTPGLQLDALEFMDDVQMRVVNEAELTDRKFDEEHSLLLRFTESENGSVEQDIEVVRKAAKKHGMKSFTFAKNATESDELWSARKTALWSMMNWASPKKMWTTDVAVPISNLSTIMKESREWLKDAGLVASIIGHVGDGNFHALIAYDPETQLEETQRVVEKMNRRAIELDGTCTGEHGIGVGKRKFLIEELGPETVNVMRQIKETLDPNMILNPGKVFQTSTNDVPDH